MILEFIVILLSFALILAMAFPAVSANIMYAYSLPSNGQINNSLRLTNTNQFQLIAITLGNSSFHRTPVTLSGNQTVVNDTIQVAENMLYIDCTLE